MSGIDRAARRPACGHPTATDAVGQLQLPKLDNRSARSRILREVVRGKTIAPEMTRKHRKRLYGMFGGLVRARTRAGPWSSESSEGAGKKLSSIE